MSLSTPFNTTWSAALDDFTYKATCVCFVYLQKLNIGNFGYDRASLLSSAEVNQRLPSEFTILTHNGINRKKKREQRKATLHCLFMPSANDIWVSLWRFCSMFQRPDVAQLWAKGEAIDNCSSISILFLIHIYIGFLLLTWKKKASVLHLWLMIDPLARLHTQESERLVNKEGTGWLAGWLAGWLTVLLALPPRFKGYKWVKGFWLKDAKGYLIYKTPYCQFTHLYG